MTMVWRKQLKCVSRVSRWCSEIRLVEVHRPIDVGGRGGAAACGGVLVPSLIISLGFEKNVDEVGV